MSEEYSLEMLEQLDACVQRELEMANTEEPDWLQEDRNKYECVIALFPEVTTESYWKLDAAQFKKYRNKAKRIQGCGLWHTHFDPTTGGHKSFLAKCEDFRVCPKCRAEKAKMEATVLGQYVKENCENKRAWKFVLAGNREYKKLQALIYREEQGVMMRRYSQADGTVIVYVSYHPEFDYYVSRDTVSAIVPQEQIAAYLQNMKPGARISGNVISDPIVKRNAPAAKEEPVPVVKSEAELHIERLQAELQQIVDNDPAADISVLQKELAREEELLMLNSLDAMVERAMEKHPEDTDKVTIKNFIFRFEGMLPEEERQLKWDALEATYKGTYMLNPDLEDLQDALRTREDAYQQAMDELIKERGFTLVYRDIYYNTRIVRRDTIDWKGYFQRSVLTQHGLSITLGDQIPDKA